MRPGRPVRSERHPAGLLFSASVRAGQPTGNSTGVRVAPGQQGRGRHDPTRTARAATAGARRRSRGASAPARRQGKEVVWLEGTVRDEQGRGVAGAHVFVAPPSTAACALPSMTQAATTDDRGRYQVRGPGTRMETRG